MGSTKKLKFGPRRVWILGVSAVLLMIGLRCVALDSDAYPRLSWSTALLTDEGFYIHNARNQVLFGHSQTDQFSNALIMPLLNAVQVGVFHLIGVGAVQARSISVVLGMLTVVVLFDALRRAFGLRTALFGGLLLGLDHVSLLYSRLALMDTPAAFVLVCAYWLWVKSGDGEQRGRVWLALCGVVLGVCYGVRGLGALIYPVPLLLLAREGWWARREGRQTEGRKSLLGLLYVVGGLVLALGVYGVAWYLPNRAELARVNHYYLFDQLVPHSFKVLLENWQTGLFGDHRGLMPFLFRHEPVQTCLALLWLVQRGQKLIQRKGELQESARIGGNADFLALWVLIFWALLCSIDYAPSRYYVLFLPAFSGLAGLMLSDVVFSEHSLKNRASAVIPGLFAFHYAQSALHHLGVEGVLFPVLIGVGCLIAAWFLLRQPRLWEDARQQACAHRLPLLAFMAWSVVNLYWTGDWLLHLTYRQRDADRWLAANLPANSVLIGAVTPGLSMNNRFVCVSVIDKLCNDKQPVEKYAPAPRYVLILDNDWREPWWGRHYPNLVAPSRRIHEFRGLLRPFFVIGLYRVPDEMGAQR